MGTLPHGLGHLCAADEVRISTEWTSFKNKYSISIPAGIILTAKGSNEYTVKDNFNTKVAEMTYKRRWFSHSSMQVSVFGSSSPYIIRPSPNNSSSLHITDDKKKLIIKVRSPAVFSMSSKYRLMCEDPKSSDYIEIGTIKNSSGDSVITFPQDLEVACKMAVISAAIFLCDSASSNITQGT